MELPVLINHHVSLYLPQQVIVLILLMIHEQVQQWLVRQKHEMLDIMEVDLFQGLAKSQTPATSNGAQLPLMIIDRIMLEEAIHRQKTK